MPDTYLSAAHFSIIVSGEADNGYMLIVEDLSSLNGTTVEWNQPSKIIGAMHERIIPNIVNMYKKVLSNI